MSASPRRRANVVGRRTCGSCRSTGPAAPDDLLIDRRPGPPRPRVPPAAARPAGDPRAAPLPRVMRRRRSLRPSASLRAPPAHDSITLTAPCAPRSRRTLGPWSRKGARHDPTNATSSASSTSGSRRWADRDPRPGHRYRRRPHRTPPPAARVAVPREGTPHDLHPQARRCVGRGAGPRRRRLQPVAGRPPGDRRSAGQPEPDNGPALVQSRSDHPARQPRVCLPGRCLPVRRTARPGRAHERRHRLRLVLHRPGRLEQHCRSGVDVHPQRARDRDGRRVRTVDRGLRGPAPSGPGCRL